MLQAITGKTIAQLDTEFRKYLDIRLAPYAGTFKLPTRGFDDVTKLEIAADAAPKDAKAKANVALGYYYAGDADKAGAAAQAALALDPKQPIARYIHAEIAVHDGDAAEGASSSTRPDRRRPRQLRPAHAARADRRRARARSPRSRSSCAPRRSSIPSAAIRTRRSRELYKKAGKHAEGARRARALRVPRADGARAAQEARHRVRQARRTGRRSAPTARWRRSSTRRTPTSSRGLGRAYLELGDSPTRRCSRTTPMLLVEPAAAPPRARPPRPREGVRRAEQDRRREGRARRRR